MDDEILAHRRDDAANASVLTSSDKAAPVHVNHAGLTHEREGRSVLARRGPANGPTHLVKPLN